MLPNVDPRTRTYLLDEFQRDVNAGRLHVPSVLTTVGAADWPTLLQLTLMESGPDALAKHLRRHGHVRDSAQASEVARGVWRRMLARAICRAAIDDGSTEVHLPPGSSTSRNGEPRQLLEHLRALVPEPAVAA